jgi:hypothetical protein
MWDFPDPGVTCVPAIALHRRPSGLRPPVQVVGTPKLPACTPWMTQSFSTSMISSIVAPSFRAALMCRRVPGAYVWVCEMSNAMLKSSASFGESTPLA